MPTPSPSPIPNPNPNLNPNRSPQATDANPTPTPTPTPNRNRNRDRDRDCNRTPNLGAQATDAGAMCFSSAVCCRIAIMLAYNVDLLLLPPHSGLQTQFYCTFAFKSRMTIGGYDYYLLCCPLLLIALCLVFHVDLLSR